MAAGRLYWNLILPDKPRLAAVSYLNTVPLVWGMTHGPQRDHFRLRFGVPSACARMIEAGEADLGIVPVAEVWRNGWETAPGCGIACRGAVRSILLVARRPWDEIRTLAADAGSRSSVLLSRIVLSRRYGARPEVREMAPDLGAMLEACDAALLIGDAALRAEPEALAEPWLDLGEEWFRMTGLPMVFATWSGPREAVARFGAGRLAEGLAGSLAFGRENLDAIVKAESEARGFAPELVRRYLTRHIRFDLGPEELAGREAYLRYAEELNPLTVEAGRR